MRREPLAGNTGRDYGPCKPVHETTMDSRTGEDILDQRVTINRQRTSAVKNRMREIRTSGSVGGEGGNILT